MWFTKQCVGVKVIEILIKKNWRPLHCCKKFTEKDLKQNNLKKKFKFIHEYLREFFQNSN